MANKSDISRNQFMLKGKLKEKGYDWWWHSFTAVNEKTGEKKPFFIEFFVVNPALTEDEPVIVWNDEEKRKNGKKPSYLMIKAGFWGKEHGQLHKFVSLKDVKIKEGAPFEIKNKDFLLNEKSTFGCIEITKEENENHPEWMCDFGTLSWNLEINKKTAFHVGYGASSFFRKINAFEMFWHAEGMKTEYKGYVSLNGEKYIVEPHTSNGYADKNWGSDFTSPWVWLSSNDLTSRISGRKLNNSVFNIGGGRPKVFFVSLNRKLLGEFYYEGKDYEFNFSKFWTLSRTKFNCIETEDEIKWHVVQQTAKAKLDTKISCRKDEMLKINYESPSGLKRHNRLWNGGTGKGILKLYKRNIFGKEELIDEVYAEGVGCEYGEYDI